MMQVASVFTSTRVRRPLPEGPAGGVSVRFVGGPRNGKKQTYPRNPQVIACVTEAHAAGMHGLYRTSVESWKDPSVTQVTARWTEMPRQAGSKRLKR